MNVIHQTDTHQAKAAGPLIVGKIKITQLAFMDRFDDQTELPAIYTAAKTDVHIEIFLDKVRAADHITLTDPRTIAGVQALADAGLIEAGRVADILAPEGGQ